MSNIPFAYTSMNQALYEMMIHFWANSGIKPDSERGAVLRTIFEAVAFEVEDRTFQFDQAVRAAIPAAVFDAFNFQPLGAASATVIVQFERSSPGLSPLTIPAGFRVGRADGVDYVVPTTTAIPAAEKEALVQMVCTTPGVRGNTPANTITHPRGSLPGLIKVTNVVPAEGGVDAETLEAQRRRFTRYIESVHRATGKALRSISMTARTDLDETPADILVLDKVHKDILEPGEIEVWVDDGTASASQDLLNAVDELIEQYRAAGVVHETFAVTPHAQVIEFTVDGNPKDLDDTIAAADEYIRNLRIGEKLSRENLITALTNAAVNSYEIDLIQPAADVPVAQTERIVATSIDGSMLS